MIETMSDADWGFLLRRIRLSSCTPFIGPEAYTEYIPLNDRIIQEWASHPEFPFTDCNSLPTAAQITSVLIDMTDTKDRFVEEFLKLPAPAYGKADEPHRVLASLPLEVYITTNYDDFMFRALMTRRDKEPRRDFCRWNQLVADIPAVLGPNYSPTVATPLVYHLYGYSHTDDGHGRVVRASNSLVLTEDDYLDFLVNTSKDQSLIPPRIQKTFTNTTLLLLGYRFDDWSFRVLFRSIVSYLSINRGDVHLAVQLAPVGEAPQQQKVQDYFNRYLGRNKIKVHWGRCQDFIAELRQRWEDGGYGA